MNFIQSLYKKLFKPTPFDIYKVIGEITGIKRLVEKFYEVMQTDPNAHECLMLHQLNEGKVPPIVKEKLSDFLSGWMGGENLFVQKYGHPRMRARHIHFKITQKEKDQWLYCMKIALDSHTPKLNKKNKLLIFNSFTALAMRIQNT